MRVSPWPAVTEAPRWGTKGLGETGGPSGVRGEASCGRLEERPIRLFGAFHPSMTRALKLGPRGHRSLSTRTVSKDPLTAESDVLWERIRKELPHLWPLGTHPHPGVYQA